MKKNNIYTISFIIIGCLLIFAVVFHTNTATKNIQTQEGVNVIFQPNIKQPSQNQSKTVVNQNGKAVLTFLPLSGEQKIGHLFNVQVVLDSQEQKSYGVDVVINYDSAMLDLAPAEVVADDSGAQIIKKWYDGEIIFSYLAPAGTSWQGKMKIAELTFTPKKAGGADLKFLFEPNSSTDCNVAGENGQDILNRVDNAQFVIK